MIIFNYDNFKQWAEYWYDVLHTAAKNDCKKYNMPVYNKKLIDDTYNKIITSIMLHGVSTVVFSETMKTACQLCGIKNPTEKKFQKFIFSES